MRGGPYLPVQPAAVRFPPMDVETAHRECGRLREQIDLGPGANDDALRKALGIVKTLQLAASWQTPRDKLTDIEANLRVWFSRKGNFGMRHWLEQDLQNVTDYWDRPPVAG